METQKELLDKFKKVCICKGITGATITKAIKEGALSFEALRRVIGTGTGNCKARRCRLKIVERVNDYKKSIETEEPDNTRNSETRLSS